MLATVQLEQFRNLADFSTKFEKRNLIVGQNGVGKSSIIEAIRLISTGKSFRTGTLTEAISFDHNFFRLQAKLHNDRDGRVEFFYGRSHASETEPTRSITFNTTQVSVLDLLGIMPTVLFTAEDLQVVLGAPATRRKFLDGMIAQIDREFTAALLQLSRILRERSSLLFLIRTNRAGVDELNPWDELLAQSSNTIRSGRTKAVELLQQTLNAISETPISLTYEAEPLDFTKVRQREIKLSQNLVGAHRDELLITYNNHAARQFTSRGQARLVTGLLKVAEVEFFNQQDKEPLLLLDDIISELDEKNMLAIFDKIGSDTQVVATAIEVPESFAAWHRVLINA